MNKQNEIDYEKVKKALDEIYDCEDEDSGFACIDFMEVHSDNVYQLIKENEQLQQENERLNEKETNLIEHLEEMQNEVELLEQQNKAYASALKDVKYQVEQSDHPAGLGALTAINETLKGDNP